MSTHFYSAGYKHEPTIHVPRAPQSKTDDSLTKEVIAQLRALCDRVESGELVLQHISFDVLERRRQKVTIEVAE